MSDDPQDTSGGVRRVSRKDRKTRLEPRKPLFPPEDDAPPPLEWAGDAAPQAEAAEAAPAPARSAPETTERFPPVEPARLKPAPPPKPAAPPRHRGSRAANLITVFFLLATLATLAYIGLLTTDPYTPLNPLPPFTPVPIIVTATPLPPTITPVPPTSTPEPTATWTPLPVETVAAPGRFTFALAVSVVYEAWDEGCDWVGITGTVVNAGGAPLAGYELRAQAAEVAEGDTSEAVTAITGDDGAFMLRLGSEPALEPYTLTLYDLSGQPLSDAYTVITSDRCDQNALVVTFRER